MQNIKQFQAYTSIKHKQYQAYNDVNNMSMQNI